MSISTKTMELLKLARCADVCDALDSMGLQDTYEMDSSMRPLIPCIRFCGIARTIELVKATARVPATDYDTFDKLQYTPKQQGGYSFTTNLDRPSVKKPELTSGDVLVVAAHGSCGVCGSANALEWFIDGVAGFVIDGGMRDTPEAILEELPVFSTSISYKACQGRNQIFSSDEPCVCAGVLVHSGDVIVADNDGVIVVPQELADEVAVRAYKIQQKDRIDRRHFYERQKRAYDETVELLPDLD